MFTEEKFNTAKEIVNILHQHNYQAVFAGGSVRDQYRMCDPKDVDIATDCPTEKIIEIFSFIATVIPVGQQFGVVRIIFKENEYELATFRRDSVESDGRRPNSVEFCSMEEDAKRRDFTINGMFFDPIENKLIDFVGGQQDILAKTIRFIGNPVDRIQEDHLRIIRGIRFANRFFFSFEKETEKAIRENVHLLTKVSIERIKEELCKIFLDAVKEKILSKVIRQLDEFGILQLFLPEVTAMKGVEQPAEFHPEGDVFIHVMKVLDFLPLDASCDLIWGTLLHDIGKTPTQTFGDRIRFNNHDVVGKEMARKRLEALRFSNEEIEHICCMIGNHMQFRFVKEMKKSTFKKLMRVKNFDEHLELHRADCLGSWGGLKNYEFAVKQAEQFAQETPDEVEEGFQCFINGHDLIEMGLKPGPIFKQILSAVEEKQLDGEVTSKEQAEQFVIDFMRK